MTTTREANTIWKIKERDRDEIKRWATAWNIDVTRLPGTGFRTKDCAMFFIKCECRVFMLDPVISRPGTLKRRTHMDVLFLADRCSEEAARLGYDKCISVTDKRGLARSMRRLGFKIGLTYIVQKDL